MCTHAHTHTNLLISSPRHKRLKYWSDHKTRSFSEHCTKARRPLIPSCFNSICVWWTHSLSRKTMRGATKQLRIRCQKHSWTRNTTYPDLNSCKASGFLLYMPHNTHTKKTQRNNSMEFGLSIHRKSTETGLVWDTPLRSQVPRSRAMSSPRQLENWRRIKKGQQLHPTRCLPIMAPESLAQDYGPGLSWWNSMVNLFIVKNWG